MQCPTNTRQPGRRGDVHCVTESASPRLTRLFLTCRVALDSDVTPVIFAEAVAATELAADILLVRDDHHTPAAQHLFAQIL